MAREEATAVVKLEEVSRERSGEATDTAVVGAVTVAATFKFRVEPAARSRKEAPLNKDAPVPAEDTLVIVTEHAGSILVLAAALTEEYTSLRATLVREDPPTTVSGIPVRATVMACDV